MNNEIQYAVNTVSFSLQCSVLLDSLHRSDPASTGFHALAARKIAGHALAALDGVVENGEDAQEFVGYCDDAANSAANILRAYLKQRNPSHDAGE